MNRDIMRAACLAGAAALAGGSPAAAEPLTLMLNWVPAGDHSPIYYAKQQGWYEDAGIELSLESGKGSGMSSQSVGAGQNPIGIADLPTAMIAKSKGADLVAVMAIYANSPQGFYWDKEQSGIEGPEDFPGHTIGNPPADASRVMWPAFASAVGIPEDSVEFVNVAPQAKMPTLMSGRVDIISDFYNGHDLKIREIGDSLGYVGWRDIGVNPIGNSIIVNRDFLEENRDLIDRFVGVTQRAYRTCAEDHAPCIDALLAQVSGHDRATQMDQWLRVEELMTTPATTEVALGYLDPEGVRESYKLVETYFDLDGPFDPESVYTNEFLSRDVAMPAE